MAHIVKRETAGGSPRWDVRWNALGRWQLKTFKRRTDADAFRRTVEADEIRGLVVDVRRSSERFDEFATAWLATRRRPDGRPLTPATRALYGDLLGRLILPTFGPAKLSSIQPAQVRAWHAGIADRVSPLQAAKAYRLMRTILNTALRDGVLAANPCNIEGGGVERSPERPLIDSTCRVAPPIPRPLRPGRRHRPPVPRPHPPHRLRPRRPQGRVPRLPPPPRRPPPRPHPHRGAGAGRGRRPGRLGTEERLLPLDDPPRVPRRRTVPAPRHLRPTRSRRIPLHRPEGWPAGTGPLVQELPPRPGGRRPARAAPPRPPPRRRDAVAQQGATTREIMARLGHRSRAAADRYQHAAARRDAELAARLHLATETARLRRSGDAG